jgi:hypothetical protein
MERQARVEDDHRARFGLDRRPRWYRLLAPLERDPSGIGRPAIEGGALERREAFEPIERVLLLEDLREGSATGAENTPAQPQAASFAPTEWGALSVPRKKRGSPDTAAARSARRCASRLTIGRQ